MNLLFGIGFALVARDRIKADGPFASPAFPLVVLHAAAVVAPIALYFYAVHPAWAWMYMFDPKKLASIMVIPLMVGHAVFVIGAWYGASLLIRKGLQGALFYIGGALALFMLIVIVIGIKRLSTAADYLGYETTASVTLFKVQLGWAFAVSLLALFGSAIYVAIEPGVTAGASRRGDMMSAMRRVALVMMLATGCGPVAYVGQVTIKADDAVEAARAAEADKYSPYYWTRATQYLHMAHDVAGHADYQGANRFGRLATEAALKAKAEAEVVAKDPTKRAVPAKDEKTVAPAKDPKDIAPAKDTP